MASKNNSSASASLPVAVDVMGGDLGPEPAIEGVVQAARELGIYALMVGDEKAIHQKLQQLGAQNDPKIRIQHASQVITMEDSPAMAIRGKPDSSIRVAFELVRKNEASSVVSAGNTGAMMAAGLFVSGTLAGIARPAIASLIPKAGQRKPTVLLDSGANVDCNAQQLVQFALMGYHYAVSALPCDRPRVALLSNGSEATKGNDIIRSAAQTLSAMEDINFIGYVEGRDIARDLADVIVCDGFVGNIVLKTIEGSVEFVINSVKEQLLSSPRGQLGMWLAKPLLKKLFLNKLDPSAYGGAPLLGLRDVAIVLHGASGKRDFFNGVRVARKFADEGVVTRMKEALTALDQRPVADYEDNVWDRVGQRFDKAEGKRSRARDSHAAVANKREGGAE